MDTGEEDKTLYVWQREAGLAFHSLLFLQPLLSNKFASS